MELMLYNFALLGESKSSLALPGCLFLLVYRQNLEVAYLE
jgi:hypothetical protein